MMSEKWWGGQKELFSLDNQKFLSEKVFSVLSPDDTENPALVTHDIYISPRELKTDTKTCM